MGMRSAVFDCWVREAMEQLPEAAVIHGGCGMDSRVIRTGALGRQWVDVDFPEVITERKRYFRETDGYHMIPADLREEGWLQQIPAEGGAIIVLEGVSMYLKPEELKTVLKRWKAYFGEVRILMDSYTVFGAKATKYKNPINEVGVTQVYGFDDPKTLEEAGLSFVREHSLTPDRLISLLPRTDGKRFITKCL